MSNINKQALREAAENATPGEWCADDMFGVVADAGLNGNFYIATCSGPDNRDNKRFIAAANPATVLALLDALEAAERRLTEVRGYNVDLAEESRQYQQRVAELEAREVKLPDVEKWRSPEAVRAQSAYRALARKELSAAGIITKVGE